MDVELTTQKIVEQFVICLFRGDNMMPVLYYLPPSPPCRALLMLARMLGIEFELKIVNILEGDHMKPEFLKVIFNLYISKKCYVTRFHNYR